MALLFMMKNVLTTTATRLTTITRIFSRLFGKDGNTGDLSVRVFISRYLSRIEISCQDIIGKRDWFVFLYNDFGKPRLCDNAQVFVFLNSTGYATGIQLGHIFPFFGKLALQYYIRNRKMTPRFQYPV